MPWACHIRTSYGLMTMDTLSETVAEHLLRPSIHLPQCRCVLVVVQGILVHAQKLIRLGEAVPRPIVLPVDVCVMMAIQLFHGWPHGVQSDKILTHSFPIRFNRCMRILHLDILVTHESPRCQVGPVKLRGAPEILDSLLMLSS